MSRAAKAAQRSEDLELKPPLAMPEERPTPPHQPPSYHPRRSSWNRSNHTGTFSIGLVVLFVVSMGIKFFAQGMHDIGMVVTIAIAAGVMFIFLAPGRFYGSDRSDDRDDGRPDLRDLSRGPTSSAGAKDEADR